MIKITRICINSIFTFSLYTAGRDDPDSNTEFIENQIAFLKCHLTCSSVSSFYSKLYLSCHFFHVQMNKEGPQDQKCMLKK